MPKYSITALGEQVRLVLTGATIRREILTIVKVEIVRLMLIAKKVGSSLQGF